MKKAANEKKFCQMRVYTHGYYAGTCIISLFVVLTGIGSILIYPLSAVVISISLFFTLIFVCSNFCIYLVLKDEAKRSGMTPKPDLYKPLRSKILQKKSLGWCVTVVLLIFGVYPLFPYWLKSLFLAPAAALLLCSMLWSTHTYHFFYQNTHKEAKNNEHT